MELEKFILALSTYLIFTYVLEERNGLLQLTYRRTERIFAVFRRAGLQRQKLPSANLQQSPKLYTGSS